MSNSNDDIIQNSSDFQINVDDDAAIYDSLNSFEACFCCNPFENLLPSAISLRGQAFDLVVVQSETTGRVASSDFLICFDHPVTPFPPVHHQHPTSSNSIVLSNMISSSDNVMGVGPEDVGVCEALLEIVTAKFGKVYFPIVHDAMSKKNRLAGQPSPNCNCMDERRSSFRPSAVRREQQQQALESEQETLLDLTKLLQPGKNDVRYLFRNQKRVLGVAHASIFLWSDKDRVVVCDVDGTITKTNVRGIYNTIVTEKYDSHCHERVCQFMSSLAKSNHCENIPDGCSCENPQEDEKEEQQSTTPLKPSNSRVNFLYLSSRPIVIADKTRKFLSNVRQHHHPAQEQKQKRSLKRLFSKENRIDSNIDNDAADSDKTVPQNQSTHKLPDGPLLGFGGKLMDVMKMELISFTVHMFKAALLVDQVVTPFCRVAQDPQEKHQSLFVAGFGNTMMDIQAYHMAGMDLSQIYFIDKKSQIVCLDAALQSQPQQRESQQKPRSSDSSMSSNTLSNSSHFLMVDGAETTKETDQRPCLRTPLSKKIVQATNGNCI